MIASTSDFTIYFTRRRSLVLLRTTTLLILATVRAFPLLLSIPSQCTEMVTVIRVSSMFPPLVVITGDNIAMVKLKRMMMFASIIVFFFMVAARALALPWGLARLSAEEAKQILPRSKLLWGCPGYWFSSGEFVPCSMFPIVRSQPLTAVVML